MLDRILLPFTIITFITDTYFLYYLFFRMYVPYLPFLIIQVPTILTYTCASLSKRYEVPNCAVFPPLLSHHTESTAHLKASLPTAVVTTMLDVYPDMVVLCCYQHESYQLRTF